MEKTEAQNAGPLYRILTTVARSPVQWLLNGVVIIVLVGIFIFGVDQQMHSGPPTADGLDYMTMAYNLINHGIISLGKSSGEFQPSAYRAPGTPHLRLLFWD
jgi:hypothetical protein